MSDVTPTLGLDEQDGVAASTPVPLDFNELSSSEVCALHHVKYWPWSVYSIKKPALRRFLRTNHMQYKSRDKKERLAQLAMELMRAEWAGSGTNQAPPPPAAEVQRPRHVCDCFVALGLLLNDREVELNEQFKGQLSAALSFTRSRLESVLALYGSSADPEGCRVQNLMAFRDCLEREFVQQQKFVVEELERVEGGARHDEVLCTVCWDREVRTCFLPCGHAICCVACTQNQDVKRCPHCRHSIEQIKLLK